MNTDRISAAYQTLSRELLECREAGGGWTGRLASSPLATATAVSALSIFRDRGGEVRGGRNNLPASLFDRAVAYLIARQRPDGGWGDTDRSFSNIATTYLVLASLHLAGCGAQHQDSIRRGFEYTRQQGEVAGVRRRYGRDKTFAVPILANAAIAGLVPWRDVPALPMEAVLLPPALYRWARLPVVSYAVPALVAVGLAKRHFDPPLNPVMRWLRGAARGPGLRVLLKMQPTSGGYLEAIPLTSFVVMALAAVGWGAHEVARRGAEFLLDTMRDDGSWPIDANLAIWNTTLAVNALARIGSDGRSALAELDPAIQWLLQCQHHRVHPFTGARPGGWGWSDLSGAVPDVDDTAGALLTLAHWRDLMGVTGAARSAMFRSAQAGIDWLLGLQNRDGGWPTFCRGWGRLPFDRSGADLTAHALRALHAWFGQMDQVARGRRSFERGFRYLQRVQSPSGCWIPLWFGNQHHDREENPYYGTAKVLMAYCEADRLDTPAARRGLQWLATSQNEDGGWGGGPGGTVDESRISSVEETALVTEALASVPLARRGEAGDVEPALQQGIQWLVDAVGRRRHRRASPIGLYFAKLWYYEELYPLTFAVAALGRYLRAPRDNEMGNAI